MTREEAIYVLKNTAWLGSGELVGDVSEAIQMAVNALKRSETPNNSDVISRQALCEYALNQKDKSVTPNDIMRFPSAQPEKLYTKADYIMALHKEYGCSLTRAEDAHNKALEYLQDEMMMEGGKNEPKNR